MDVEDMPQLRVGIVGAGYISDFHAHAIAATPGARLVAVADLAFERARALARRHGARTAYPSLEAMLRGERLDVLHVLVPPDARMGPTLAALDAGAHVLLEKPMCHRIEGCEQMCERALETGRRLGVSHNFLFTPAYERLRTDLREGRIGRVDEIEIVWNKVLPQALHGPFDVWMLRHPRNVLFEIAPHSFAHALDLTDALEILDVEASNPRRLDDARLFYRRWYIRARSGATDLHLRFSFVEGYPEHRVRIRGTMSSATCDFERNLYHRHHHRPFALDFDRYAAITSEAASAVGQATRTLTQYALSKAKLSKVGAPFQASITRAVQRFYADLSWPLDRRLDPEFGMEVVRMATEAAGSSSVTAPVTRPAPGRRLRECTPLRPTVLVTGGTGFIGQSTVLALRRKGYGVRVLSRARSLPPELQAADVELLTGRLTRPETIERALDGIEHCIHLARSHGHTWADYRRFDVDGTRNLAEASARRGLRRFVYASSIVVYDAGRADAIIKDDTAPDSDVASSQAYARSKAMCEQMLREMHASDGFPVVIVRPGIVVGGASNPRHWGVGMWPHHSVCEIWGAGESPLPLVLVDDVADAIVRCIETDGVEGESFNLVDDPLLTAHDYLDEMERACGFRIERHPTPIWKFFATDILKWAIKSLIRHPERQRPSLKAWSARRVAARFDCSKAKRLLGWKPTENRITLVERGIAAPVREHLT